METPLGGPLGGTEKAVSRTIGRIGAYFVYALAALAVGIAFGLGGRDYVAENIGDWLPGRSPDTPATAVGQTDGGGESID